MLEKKALTKQQIAEIIAKRWSCRSFNPDKKVSREDIISICESARWAPSCFGDEPWNFIICDKFHNKISWELALDCLGEWNQNWAKNAPVLIISLALKVFRKNGKENRWSKYDTGAACENICLQAIELGLMAHQMGGFEENKVIANFDILDNFDIMSIIAVGYQDKADKLNEELYKLEISERKRRLLGDNFFDSEMNNPIA
jgi:nitroreductase